MQKIVIIFPYFGTLPVQYKMWRASALKNPTVDFLFFTDADVEPAKNILVHNMRFEEFQKITQQAFDFPIVLNRPYKLCEYNVSTNKRMAIYCRSILKNMIFGALVTLIWSMVTYVLSLQKTS